MVQTQTILTVADNSGAKKAKVIGIPGSSKRRWAGVGDAVMVAIQAVLPNGNIKAHQVFKAVVIRTAKETKRADGSYVRFDDNACVLIDAKKAPLGTRVFGPVARELKESGYDKILSRAPEVL